MIKHTLSEEQLNRLNRLWFIYGNHGKKSTMGNHRFIQNILQRSEDDRDFYLEGPKNMREKGRSEESIKDWTLTQECIEAVDEILKNKIK